MIVLEICHGVPRYGSCWGRSRSDAGPGYILGTGCMQVSDMVRRPDVRMSRLFGFGAGHARGKATRSVHLVDPWGWLEPNGRGSLTLVVVDGSSSSLDSRSHSRSLLLTSITSGLCVDGGIWPCPCQSFCATAAWSVRNTTAWSSHVCAQQRDGSCSAMIAARQKRHPGAAR